MTWFNKRQLKIIGLQISALSLFILIWEMLVKFNVLPRLLVASPSQLIQNLDKIILNVEFHKHLVFSLYVIAVSMLLAVLGGLGLGIILGSIKFLKEGLLPYFILIYSVPKAIFLPIFWFLFGLGFNYQVAFAVFHGILPMTINIAISLATINPNWITVAKSFGASSYQIYRKIAIPSLVPIILGSIRICFHGVIVGTVVSQIYVGALGIGFLARYYTALFQTLDLYLLLVIVSIIVVILYWILIKLEINYLSKRNLLISIR
jgi:NitT/TauT family transport system permease protein